MTPPRWSALLVVAVIALLPVGRGAEAPLIVAAALGVALAWRHRRDLWTNAGVRLATLLFACYWLPALISAPDAFDRGKSWSTVRDLLRFLPFCVFACLALRADAPWRGIVQAVAALVGLWLIDAWVQAFTGYGVAGAAEKERLSGIFGAGNLKLGPVLAVLAPFVLAAARDAFGRRGLAAAFLFLLVPILLAGSRAAWLMYGLVTLAFAWRETRAPLRFIGWSAAAFAIALLAAVVALHDSRAFAARVERSLLALNGSVQAVDAAGAGRVQIWRTAARMIADHPFNGVGVRGFRYAYPQYALPGDRFLTEEACAPGEGACHAHQIVLEVLSETGVVGLAGWIAGLILALRAWRRAPARARERALAPALALATMTFPLDTHLAFYSAWWGLLFWWLLALFCAAVSSDAAELRDAA